jgi:hypothetical protein
MSPTQSPPPQSLFEVVPRGRAASPRWTWMLAALGVGLALGLGLAWWLHQPAAGSPEARLVDAERRLREQQQVIGELRQRVATLNRSDQISREANRDVQDMLAEKDEQIASLRADVAFYERFVGSGAERKGLSVHSTEFTPQAGGGWRYQVVLTQSLNRGAVSQGELRFAVEGVRAGKLTTVNWDELHQTADAPGQHYAFRYFQRLEGSVILPPGFTPQRVKVSLRGSGGGTKVDQAFAWTSTNTPGEG